MAKKAGFPSYFFLDGYDLSGDVGTIDIAIPRETLRSTGLNVSGQERMYGLAAGSMDWTAYFNPAVGAAHDRFGNLPTADVVACYFDGSTVGNQAAGMVAKQVNYDGSRGDDGSLTFKVSALSNAYALSWGEMLTTGKQTFASTGAGTVLDYGAGVGTTNFGLIAFLQVFALTSGSPVVAIQSSTDNGADAYANVTGAVFTTVAGVGAERIQTGATAAVERYLRVNITGTFSNLTCAVHCFRPLAAWNL